MFNKPKFSILALVLTVLVFAQGCDKDQISIPGEKYGIFSIQDDTAAVLYGTIRTRTLEDFQTMMSEHPQVKLLILEDVPGSVDDEMNLLMGKEVYKHALNTHLPDGAEIASGGVDLFLAGRKRTASGNVLIGVHSWSSGSLQASDLPADDPQHQPYIDYFKAVGMTDKQASDFYFFTIYAASAKDMHWMTPAEIEQYGIFTE